MSWWSIQGRVHKLGHSHPKTLEELDERRNQSTHKHYKYYNVIFEMFVILPGPTGSCRESPSKRSCCIPHYDGKWKSKQCPERGRENRRWPRSTSINESSA